MARSKVAISKPTKHSTPQSDWHAALVSWGLPAPDAEPLTVNGTILPLAWRSHLAAAAIGAVDAETRAGAEALGFTIAILPEAPGEKPPSELVELFGTADMTRMFAPGDLVYARGREWVTLPSPDDDTLYLRPLSGAEADVQVIHPALEREPVRPAQFRPTRRGTKPPPRRVPAFCPRPCGSRSDAALGRSARQRGWPSSRAPISSCRC